MAITRKVDTDVYCDICGKAIRRLELAGGYTPMPTAPAVEFEF